MDENLLCIRALEVVDIHDDLPSLGLGFLAAVFTVLCDAFR